MRLLPFLMVIVALMVVTVVPLGIGLAQEVNSSRTLPDAVHSGQTFDVTVTFSSPDDNFNAIGLTDLAPDGWNVTLDETWCTPNAGFVNAIGNKAEIMWFGPYASGTTVSAVYKVTVPDDASAGIYAFSGSLEYYIGPEGPYSENTTGDSQTQVVGGGGISVGVWWIVGIVVGIAIIVAAVLVVRRRRA